MHNQKLQDAKARFSDLVRRVLSKAPQPGTAHGWEEVVIISAEEFRRLRGDPTGQALIAAMQASPHKDIEITPSRGPLPVRDVVTLDLNHFEQAREEVFNPWTDPLQETPPARP